MNRREKKKLRIKYKNKIKNYIHITKITNYEYVPEGDIKEHLEVLENLFKIIDNIDHNLFYELKTKYLLPSISNMHLSDTKYLTISRIIVAYNKLMKSEMITAILRNILINDILD